MLSTEENTSMYEEEPATLTSPKTPERVTRYNLRSSRKNSDLSMESEEKLSLEASIERIVKEA
jgi:hypothetical protein